jgi:hypothetical protein
MSDNGLAGSIRRICTMLATYINRFDIIFAGKSVIDEVVVGRGRLCSTKIAKQRRKEIRAIKRSDQSYTIGVPTNIQGTVCLLCPHYTTTCHKGIPSQGFNVADGRARCNHVRIMIQRERTMIPLIAHSPSPLSSKNTFESICIASACGIFPVEYPLTAAMPSAFSKSSRNSHGFRS